MKKLISIILCAVIAASCTAFSSGAKTSDNEYIASSETYEESTLLYVKNKYIFSGEKGVCVKKSINGKAKKVTSKVNFSNILSNGSTVYFTTQKFNKDNEFYSKITVYSIKTNGKGLKKITTLKGNYFNFISVYNGNIYASCGGAHYMSYLYKINPAKKTAKNTGVYCAGGYRQGSKIYFTSSHSDADEYPVCSCNLKTGEKKTVLNPGFVIGKSVGYDGYSKKLALQSYKCNSTRSAQAYKNIYTYKSNGKFKKSKDIPKEYYADYVLPDGKTAIISKGNSYCKFNLNSGKKTKIKTTFSGYPYETEIVADTKTGKPYFAKITNGRLYIKKLSGNKAVSYKIKGKPSINILEAGEQFKTSKFWIAGGYLAIDDNNNGKFKIYRLTKK